MIDSSLVLMGTDFSVFQLSIMHRRLHMPHFVQLWSDLGSWNAKLESKKKKRFIKIIHNLYSRVRRRANTRGRSLKKKKCCSGGSDGQRYLLPLWIWSHVVSCTHTHTHLFTWHFLAEHDQSAPGGFQRFHIWWKLHLGDLKNLCYSNTFV